MKPVKNSLQDKLSENRGRRCRSRQLQKIESALSQELDACPFLVGPEMRQWVEQQPWKRSDSTPGWISRVVDDFTVAIDLVAKTDVGIGDAWLVMANGFDDGPLYQVNADLWNRRKDELLAFLRQTGDFSFAIVSKDGRKGVLACEFLDAFSEPEMRSNDREIMYELITFDY